MTKEFRLPSTYQNPAKNSEARALNNFPKGQSNVYRGKVNNIIGNLNGKNNIKKPFSKKIDGSSITTGGKPKKLNYSPLTIIYRKNVNKVIGGVELGLNFAKEMGFNPYLQEQLNSLNFLSGNIIERDRDRAAATGGLLTPRFPLGMFITNYPRTWIDKTVYALAPQTANAIFDTRQRLNNAFLSPLSRMSDKGRRISRDLERKFYTNQEYKEKLTNRKELRKKIKENTLGKIVKIEDAINKKIEVPRLKLEPNNWSLAA